MEELGIEILAREQFVSLYRDKDEGKVYLSVAIPQSTQIATFYAEIFRILHDKVKRELKMLKLHAIDGLEVGERTGFRLAYRVEGDADLDGVFGRVVELFYESVLESTFGDAVKATAVREALAAMQRRMQLQQRSARTC